MLDPKVYQTLIDLALAEDLAGAGDITSLATISPDHRSTATIEARQTLVVCGLDLVQAVFHRLGSSLEINFTRRDGATVAAAEAIGRMAA